MAESATATRAARPALRRIIFSLTSRLAPPVSRTKRSSRNGVTVPAAHATGPELFEGPAEHPVVQLRVELLPWGQGVGDHDARAAEPERGQRRHEPRRLLLVSTDQSRGLPESER